VKQAAEDAGREEGLFQRALQLNRERPDLAVRPLEERKRDLGQNRRDFRGPAILLLMPDNRSCVICPGTGVFLVAQRGGKEGVWRDSR